jgi:hypothetical protein
MKKYKLRYRFENHIIHTTNNYKVFKSIPSIGLKRGDDFFVWCYNRERKPQRLRYYSEFYTPEEKLAKIRNANLDKLIAKLDLELC